MTLYLLDYGVGNGQPLANAITSLGHPFQWVKEPADFDKADSLIFSSADTFQTAVAHLTSRGLLEPLRAYIQSGKPYFGISIGMQILFQAHQSKVETLGLGIAPTWWGAARFRDPDIPVHMGWNTADLTHNHDPEGISASSFYYFAHTECVTYNPNVHDPANLIPWIHSTTQHVQQIFVSSVRHENVFATQFLPEKSGKAGLALLDAWIRKPLFERTQAPSTPPFVYRQEPKEKLTKRIIACMIVRVNEQGGLVVTSKDDQYDVRGTIRTPSSPSTTALGNPVALAKRYAQAGADEIYLLNVASSNPSPLQDQLMLAAVRTAAESIFIPLTVGGLFKDTVDPNGTPRSALDVASAYFRAGADKVCIGYAEALYDAVQWTDGNNRDPSKTVIGSIAAAYGKQAVAVSLDLRREFGYTSAETSGKVIGAVDSPWELERGRVWSYRAPNGTNRINPIILAQFVETVGAGEIILNTLDRDGSGWGFDVHLINLIKGAVKIPVVVGSGAGAASHFVEVFRDTKVEAALTGDAEIPFLKRTLREGRIHFRAD